MKIKRLVLEDKYHKKRIARLSQEDEISQLYIMYREPFIAFAIKHFNYNKDAATDIYQDSFLAMYENIINGSFTHLSTSLKTYLFQIGKFKMLNKNRQSKNREEIDINNNRLNIELSYTEDQTTINSITFEEVSALKEPCYSVLSLYYWERQSMKQIAHTLNYKNEQVAKNRKWLCLKKLKSTLKLRFEKEGLTYNDN